MSIRLIAAVGTPLTSDESLHVEGLDAHLDDQWRHGMTGCLIGGTMGALQLLTEQTYRDLVTHGTRLAARRGEVLVGVGDAGFARTCERIRFANTQKVDGVVVLSPYLFRFSPAEVEDYFLALARIATRPLYLYDLPGLTGVKLSMETVCKLAAHSNIRGIKCSGDLGSTRQLIDCAPAGFRVIVAQADLIDVLLRHGVREHLDGVFALAPRWVERIAHAAVAENWSDAARAQEALSSLLRTLKQYGVFATFTALLNRRGIPGNYAPAPYRPLDPERLEALLAEPIIREFLSETSPRRVAAPKAASFAANSDGDGEVGAATTTTTATTSAATTPRAG
jgi:4-hydroxy-tetrahydrodipicolinate synthase